MTAPLARATQVIANWDLVPGQMISQPIKVGVVAFHETGANVDFRVNGQAVASVDEPTWNDRTGVHEYWFSLNPRDYADGPLTLSATAKTDGAGEPRTLSDVTLYANANGSLANPNIVWVDCDNGDDGNPGTEAAPKETINAGVQAAGDGGTVYLKASQNYGLTSISGGEFTYWTTVSAAPGLGVDDVKIITYGGNGTTGRYGKSGIRWKNVSLYGAPPSGYSNLFYINNGQRCWFDECWLYDENGRWNGTTIFNNQGGVVYLTNSKISDVNNAGGNFQRNMLMERIGSDIYRVSTNLVAINVTIRLIDRGETDAHPDFIQLYNPNGTSENVILYNIQCYDMLAQGFFGGAGTAEDVAFVNIILEKDPPSSSLRTQLTGDWHHVLFWNITEVDQTFDFRNTASIADVDVRNCVFATFTTDNVAHPSINIDYAHTSSLQWNQTQPLGNNTSFGDPMFVDYDNDDYRLMPESPAYGTGSLPPGVPADVDGHLYDPAAPNRGVFAKSNPGPAVKKKTLNHLVDFKIVPKGPNVDLSAILCDEPTKRYLVEASDDLQAWEPLSELYADPAGLLNILETFPAMPQSRFYRLTQIVFPHAP